MLDNFQPVENFAPPRPSLFAKKSCLFNILHASHLFSIFCKILHSKAQFANVLKPKTRFLVPGPFYQVLLRIGFIVSGIFGFVVSLMGSALGLAPGLVSSALRLVPGFLGPLFGLVIRLFGRGFGGLSGVAGSVFRVRPGILHVLFRAIVLRSYSQTGSANQRGSQQYTQRT